MLTVLAFSCGCWPDVHGAIPVLATRGTPHPVRRCQETRQENEAQNDHHAQKAQSSRPPQIRPLGFARGAAEQKQQIPGLLVCVRRCLC